MDKFRHIDTWIFDLDNTLYDAEAEVFTRVGDRMTQYVIDFLKVSPEEANMLRKDYWKKHGTTLRGLMLEHDVAAESFLAHVHDIDISDVKTCALTQDYLAHLPGKKIIFTNAPTAFATRMIRHLDIGHHFNQVFTIEDAEFLPKPHPDTYQKIIKKFNINPATSCMFEDMQVNLKPAADLGMTTVWLHGREPADHPHVHHKAEKLSDWLRNTIRKN